MNHTAAPDDRAFAIDFSECRVPAASFDHAAHLRLAYVYLCDLPPLAAAVKIKQDLLRFLDHLGIDRAKYHETLTTAWTLAVDYFMSRTTACDSAAQFIARNPELLDTQIMLTHYTKDLLFSSAARAAFVAPDIQSIPPPQAA